MEKGPICLFCCWHSNGDWKTGYNIRKKDKGKGRIEREEKKRELGRRQIVFRNSEMSIQ